MADTFRHQANTDAAAGKELAHTMIFGAPSTGKTTVLASIAALAKQQVPHRTMTDTPALAAGGR